MASSHIGHAVAVDYVWLALLFLAMGGLWWVAYRMEPHWASKDGRRFMCTAQDISDATRPGRIREAKVMVTPDGALVVTRKNGLRREDQMWRLAGKSPSPPRRKQIYLAERNGDKGREMLALRLPDDSRCLDLLDRALAGRPLDD